MTHFWQAGLPIEAQKDAEGLPTQLYWDDQCHPVQVITNHWRVDLGWWRLRICRDYYKVATTTGLLLVIYCDRMTNRWSLQRLYD